MEDCSPKTPRVGLMWRGTGKHKRPGTQEVNEPIILKCRIPLFLKMAQMRQVGLFLWGNLNIAILSLLSTGSQNNCFGGMTVGKCLYTKSELIHTKCYRDI